MHKHSVVNAVNAHKNSLVFKGLCVVLIDIADVFAGLMLKVVIFLTHFLQIGHAERL